MNRSCNYELQRQMRIKRMKMQLAILGMMLLPTVALAAPDFAGSWLRDNAKSDPAPNTMYWMTRGATTMGGGRGNAQVILNIQQDAKALQVDDAQSAPRNYILDGKPHSRPTDTGIQKAEVTANLQTDALIIETTQPFGGMPGNATLTVKEVWSLSPDGKTLTVTATRDLPARQQTYKQVYIRTQPASAVLCSAGCVPAPK
jgi:hypothetical protein